MPADDLQYRVHFGLDLTYACNYHCPYCVLPPVLKHRSVEEWVRAWRRVYDRHGRCYIYMSGGEPSIYPGFYDLVRTVTEMHTVDLCTNLSWQVERLVPALSPEVFRVSATFHPSQVGLDEFLGRAVRVRDYLPQRFPPRRSIYVVAEPAAMDRLPEIGRRLEEHGMVLVPLPLMKGNEPANDDAEKRRIDELSPNRETWDRKLEYQLQERTPKGRLCHAGQRYVHIRGDGKVDRCTRYEDRQLGDFFSEDFALWPEPRVCYQEWCPFESQWLVREPAGEAA